MKHTYSDMDRETLWWAMSKRSLELLRIANSTCAASPLSVAALVSKAQDTGRLLQAAAEVVHGEEPTSREATQTLLSTSATVAEAFQARLTSLLRQSRNTVLVEASSAVLGSCANDWLGRLSYDPIESDVTLMTALADLQAAGNGNPCGATKISFVDPGQVVRPSQGHGLDTTPDRPKRGSREFTAGKAPAPAPLTPGAVGSISSRRPGRVQPLKLQSARGVHKEGYRASQRDAGGAGRPEPLAGSAARRRVRQVGIGLVESMHRSWRQDGVECHVTVWQRRGSPAFVHLVRAGDQSCVLPTVAEATTLEEAIAVGKQFVCALLVQEKRKEQGRKLSK